MEINLNIPKKIYKYQPATVQSLINLKSQSIYFNSPSKFNDPFDCNIKLKVKDLNEKDIKELKNYFLKDMENESWKKELNSYSSLEFLKIANDVIDERINSVYKKSGICCFSENEKNQLMWSHYASSGKGFCLEFDTIIEPFQKILPVEYEDTPPFLDLVELITSTDIYLLKKLFCLKSSDWAYEKEWRCFHKETNKSYGYESVALTGVYFGSEIETEFLEIICLILQGQNPNVKFYQALKSKDSWNLQFEEINYLPHSLIK
jgi:hypothetical protein